MSRNRRRGTAAAACVSAPAEPGRTASEIEEIEPFPLFDVVSDHSDHYFCNATQSIPAQTVTKIMQEWKLLEQHLPESITVRAFEKRVNLLRAAVVGASATPYHDGLYFFDISFPAHYPTQPPQVHYRAFGHRINPNLYSDGVVCLSLLNTWRGKRKSERWNPAESTILQVLLSIQALVLNERPYYNEPGHGAFKPGTSGEEKSLAYNEEIFVLSCRSVLHLIKTPPKGFEAFVAWHFRDRARAILQACEAYANGRVQVGYFREGAPRGPSRVGVPENFKRSIKRLYPQLYQAFSQDGASLAGLSKELSLDETPRRGNPPPAPPAKGKKGLAVKVVGMVKKLLGLK